MLPTRRDRFLGCLLGGAAGDALGAPVEFMRRDEIVARFGPGGITAFAPAYGRTGAITDDTQMTLFTAEGLLRAWVRGASTGIPPDVPGAVARAYLRWLETQGLPPAVDAGADGWLFAQRDLHARRAPGRTCVEALCAMRRVDEAAVNGSKGCGGVMRAAPVGLFAARADLSTAYAFDLGCDIAAVTHGHPTGQLTAGVLAALITEICRGASLDAALDTATALLVARPAHVETLDALMAARTLAANGVAHETAILRLGSGWIAEEALAIGVYCAVVAADFTDGVVKAVNHDGDSDSTGAIAGNILGAQRGVAAIPAPWLDDLELRDVIAQVARDLDQFPDWPSDGAEPDAAGRQRYPGR